MQTVYRFKLCPNSSQRETILRWRPMLRSFYNFCLRDRIDSYAQTKLQGQYCDLASSGVATPLSCSVNRSADIGYPWKSNDLSKRRNPKGEFNPKRSSYEMQSSNISYLRKTRPWYQKIPYDVLQQSLRHLDTAFNNFFTGKAKFPRFKKLGDVKGFEFKPKSVRVNGNYITLPTLGTMKFFKSRPIESHWQIKTVTLTIEADGFYVSILLKDERIPNVSLKKSEEIKTVIAGDVGIKKLVSLSDGTLIENPQYLKKNERRLTLRQRRLSRKKKGSKNRGKAAQRVAKVHQKIRRKREDYQWKVAKVIASKGDLIGFEDLQIQNMKARCRPQIDPETGRYLRNGQSRKSQLNKAISDASWYALRIKTTYQASKLGNRVITVNPRGSSQTCSECGYVSPKNRDKEKFVCECCGYYEDADIQAAKVLQQRTIEAFFNPEKSQKSSQKSKPKSSKKSAKKSPKKSSSKLRRVTSKVTPSSESTGANKGEKSVSKEVEPGNPDVVKYRQLSLFNDFQEWETG
jgi:putative transposase